jgi:hypothetical protein
MPSPVPSTPPSPADLQLIQELAAMAPPSRANFTPPALLDPNYIPPDRGGAIIGVTVVTTLVAFAAVCIRIYVRAIRKDLRLWLERLYHHTSHGTHPNLPRLIGLCSF